MNDRVQMPMRPRRLVWLTLAMAAATVGLALRWASPALSPAGVTHVPVWFDIAFGVIGGAGLAWIAVRLWRRFRRDSAAAVFALSGWTLLAAGVALRSVLFAQADYERGRGAFAVVAGVLAVCTALLWWRRQRASTTQPPDTGYTEGFEPKANHQQR